MTKTSTNAIETEIGKAVQANPIEIMSVHTYNVENLQKMLIINNKLVHS